MKIAPSILCLAYLSPTVLGIKIALQEEDYHEQKGRPPLHHIRRNVAVQYDVEQQSALALGAVLSLENGVPTFHGLVSYNKAQYLTNITVNNRDVTVNLDIGSPDVWVKAIIGQYRDLKLPLELKDEESGSVSGSIGVARLSFGTYEIEERGFLNVTQDSRAKKAGGTSGFLGLGLNTWLDSPLRTALVLSGGNITRSGYTILQSLFSQSGNTRNFIAISLGRDGEGDISIGQNSTSRTAVQSLPKMSQHSPGYWSTLLDGVTVDGATVDLNSTVKDVASGKAVALVDASTASARVPAYLLDAIYSKIPGATRLAYEHGDRVVYQVPCKTTTSVVLTFEGGNKVPIHPLDLSTMLIVGDPKDKTGYSFTICVSSMVGLSDPGTSGTPPPYDIVLGNTLLRNTYSLFDFGDNEGTGELGDAYMQLAPITDPSKASAEVSSIRGTRMKNTPPELTEKLLATLVKTSGGNDGSLGNPPNIQSDTSEDSVSLTQLKKYGVVAVALLILNAFIGMGVIAIGVLIYVRRGHGAGSRNGAPHYVPVKQNRESSRDGLRDSYRESNQSFGLLPTATSSIPTPNYSQSGL